jgi:hypothetical protein
MQDLAQSLNPNRPIPGIEKAKLEDFPKDLPEYFGEYTFVNDKQKWYDIYSFIEEAITGKQGQGTAVFDFDKGILRCTMGVLDHSAKKQDDSKEKEENQQQNGAAGPLKIEFGVKVYRSLVWAAKMQEALQELEKSQVEEVLIVRFTRTGGDPLTYNKIVRNFLLGHCTSIIKGLPKWARKMEEEQQGGKADENNKENAENDDEYDTQLANDEDLFKPQQTITVN